MIVMEKLVLVDYNETFVLRTDASNYAMGTVLGQENIEGVYIRCNRPQKSSRKLK